MWSRDMALSSKELKYSKRASMIVCGYDCM
jgi:hypothetical protein